MSTFGISSPNGTIGRGTRRRSFPKPTRTSKKDNKYVLLATSGNTALSGAELIKCELPNRPPAWIPAECRSWPGVEILDALSARGMPLNNKDALDVIIDQLPLVRTFPAASLLDRPGHTAGHVGLPGGRVYSPSGADTATATYPVHPNKNQLVGELANWLAAAELIAGQALPMLVVMLAIAIILAEMLDIPFKWGWEIVGQPGTGKADLLALAAAVTGSIGIDPMPFMTVVQDSRSVAKAYRGSLIIIGDPSLALAGESPGKTGLIIRDLVAGIAGSDNPTATYIIAGTVSLVDKVVAESDLGVGIRQHLITLGVPQDRPYGVFTKVKGTNLTAFSERLRRSIISSQGQLLDGFTRRLVQECSTDVRAVRALVRTRIRRLRKRARTDMNNSATVREVDAFGLLAAAGWLARRYQLLPESWDCDVAALRCYRRYRVAPPPPPTHEEFLEEVAAGAGVHLHRGVRIDPEVITAAQIFVRHSAKARRLLIRRDALNSIPGLAKRLRDPAMQNFMVRDGKHLYSQQRLQYGSDAPLEPVYTFTLPPAPG